MQEFFFRLLNPALIWIFIPITWLVLTSIVEILKLVQKHRERMALIHQGIHPDLELEEASADFDGEMRSTPAREVERATRETAEYVR